MRIFNSDGLEAATCGNGIRCFVRFIAELGFPHRNYQIETAGQIVETAFVGDRIRVVMELPTPLKPPAFLGSWEVHSACVGVPHAVVQVPSIAPLDLSQVGPLVRHHPYFAPHGINVNFVAPQPDGSLEIRTFERGVEGETWACGTGAVAAAFLLRLKGPVQCRFPGGELEVSLEGGRAWMTGPAQVVFTGKIVFF